MEARRTALAYVKGLTDRNAGHGAGLRGSWREGVSKKEISAVHTPHHRSAFKASVAVSREDKILVGERLCPGQRLKSRFGSAHTVLNTHLSPPEFGMLLRVT